MDTKTLEAAVEKFEGVETKISEQNEAISEIKEEIANMATRPTHAVETKSEKELIKEADFGEMFSGYLKASAESEEVRKAGFEQYVAKNLNLGTGSQGGFAVAEILDRDILKRARDEIGIIGRTGARPMTRDYRRTVTTGFASVNDGFENVAGSSWAENDTPEMGEIRSKVAKRHGKYRITDEAYAAADINLWSDLMYEVQIVENEWLERQILFGSGQDTSTSRTMRGILSSNRLDITNNTGEAWKPTYGSDSRNLDHYPAYPTGVATGMPTDDADKINWILDLMKNLPIKYRSQARFYCHDDFLTELKKIRDSENRPIFTEYTGEGLRVFGKELVTSDFWPNLDGTTPNVPFLMYGDLSQAFNVTTGDVNKTLIDEITVDGNVLLKKSLEYFECVGANDAIIIGVATTNSGA